MTVQQQIEALRARAADFLHARGNANGEGKFEFKATEDQAAYDAMISAAETLETGGLLTQDDVDANPPPIGGPSRGRGIEFVDQNGRRVKALEPDEPIAEPRGADGPSVGHVVRGMLTGNWGDYGPMAGNMVGGGDKGGWLVTPQMSGEILDLARSQAVLLKAGAQTIPMGQTDELIIARLTQDVTAHFRYEGVEIPASTVRFGTLHLRPQVIAALVPITVELAEDAPNAVGIIEQSMAESIGLALDRAGLFGKPDAAGNTPTAGSPVGIVNEEGIHSVTGVGTPGDYVDATIAIRKILDANYPLDDLDKLAWIAAPRDWETYDSLTDQTDQPLQPTPWASKPRQLSTTSMPTDLGGGAESLMLIGDFRQVVIAMRNQGIRLEVFDVGTARDENGNTINAISQMYKWIRAYIRVDVGGLRPAFFTKLTGVTVGA